MDAPTTLWDRVVTNAHDLVLFASVAFFFGLVKIFSTATVLHWKDKILTLFVSVLLGTLAGQIALEAGYADFISLGVTSLVSLMSREIIAGILNKQFISDLAKQAATNVVDKVTK